MRVIPLPGDGRTYSCVSYLVLGDWNRLDDVNTLVDTGADGSVVAEIERHSTGFGKRAVAQVVLTHGHFDHVGGAGALRERYGARVRAFHPEPWVDEPLADGDELTLGDRRFRVLHTPGHSGDSVCLYCPEERALFSGDTNLQIRSAGGSYSPEYVRTLERLARLEIDVVYPGHGAPLRGEARAVLTDTLRNVRRSAVGCGGATIT